MIRSHTGVTLRSMDDTPNTEDPQVEPLDWSKLDPKLTKAIVEAQRLATTVDNDGHNKAQDYRYPTQAAIADKAREAMGGAGLALIQLGWSKGGDGIVFAEFILLHQDGPMSPKFGAAMPLGRNPDMTKALAGALSILRKYVLAGLLNMGWRDPSEDPDADKPQRQNQNQQRQQQQRPPQNQQQARPNPVDEHRSKLLRDAQGWWKWLVDKGVSKSSVLQFVSGLDGSMPKPAPTSLLEAIVTTGKSMSNGFTGELPANSHSALISFLKHCEVPILWCDGNSTSAGDSVDAEWPAGR